MHSCAACGRELPSGFPGASITCVCGVSTVLEAARPSSTSSHSLHHVGDHSGDAPFSGGPYRGPSSLPGDAAEMRCPYCGNMCPALVRVCPHCDVRFDNVRCNRCYSLQSPGAFTCGRCGQGLELEAVLDATDAPCPRCNAPLEAAGAGVGDASDTAPGMVQDARVHECPRCGGMFIPRDALAEILCRAEISGPFADRVRSVMPLDQVKYVKCPLCHSSMNRVNFGKVSGVIVDVCRAHGTWFDGGELTRVVGFAASGGLQKMRMREEQDRKDLLAQGRHAAQHGANMLVVGAHVEYEETQRLNMWRDFLHSIFTW